MRIELKDVINLVSIKTGINKRYITFDASFEPAEEDVGKNCPDWQAKNECLYGYNKDLSRGLAVSIYAKGYEVLRFYAKDVTPRSNDIYELMRVDYSQGCIGPGFYYYYPFLILDSMCDKKDIKKFTELVAFNTDKAEVVSFPKESAKHINFLKSLPNSSLTKSFFKGIKSPNFASSGAKSPAFN